MHPRRRPRRWETSPNPPKESRPSAGLPWSISTSELFSKIGNDIDPIAVILTEMARYDNYPDDIRCYDHDPRSPFYDNPQERAEEEALESLPGELHKQAERLGYTLSVEVEVEADEDGPYMCSTFYFGEYIFEEGDAKDLAVELGRLDRERPDLDELVWETVER